MGFIPPLPLLNMMCGNRADLTVCLSVPDLVSFGHLLPDRSLKLAMLPWKADPVLSFGTDTFICLFALWKKQSARGGLEASRSPVHEWGGGNRSALCAGWNFLSQELQLALWASQGWLQWSPFSRLNNHANISSSLRGLKVFNKILLIQIKRVSYLELFQKQRRACGTSWRQ